MFLAVCLWHTQLMPNLSVSTFRQYCSFCPLGSNDRGFDDVADRTEQSSLSLKVIH